MDKKLAQLSNRITKSDRDRIEAAIAAKVPRPTPDEYKAAIRGKAELLGWDDLSQDEQALLADEEDALKARPSSAECCSFCGKSEADVHTLITGGAAYICDECIEKAAAMVSERKARPA